MMLQQTEPPSQDPQIFLLRIHYMPGTMLGAEDVALNILDFTQITTNNFQEKTLLKNHSTFK